MSGLESVASAIETMTAHSEAAAVATEQLAEVVEALTEAEGNIIPPVFADGVREAFGVDLAELAEAEDEDTAPGFVVPAWLEDGATLESFLITAEIDGKTHTMRAGFVHVDNLPFLGSDSPAALRALATHCAELADRLEAQARHTPGAEL